MENSSVESFEHSEEFSLPRLPRTVTEILENADIRIGGSRNWDIQFNSPQAMACALAQGSLGLGEAYMHGLWDANRVDQFFEHLLRTRSVQKIRAFNYIFHSLRARLLNLQSVGRAWQVGEHHYDLGNDFYEAMLDPRMTYTCGYWKNANTLTQAQENKLELICQKLQLQPGMRVLDIGCGWGSFMGYAAEHYGVECVGVTISREQVAWAREKYRGLALEFRLQDYRQVNERFDRIVSVGMFEHVGSKNYRTFMALAERCLVSDGLFLLHTIGKNYRRMGADPWVHKYIFPNGELPTIGEISRSVENLFVVEDLHNFGSDYDKTLMAWHANFEASWPRFADTLEPRFYRMWRYYLLMSAGAFRARYIQLWQWVLSPKGVAGGYERVT